MIREPKIKGTFICGPLFFKWMDIFQSWLDCFSIGKWAFIHYSKYKLVHLQKSLYTGLHLLQFLNALTCSPITLFFKCIKLHQMLSLFSTIVPAYVLRGEFISFLRSVTAFGRTKIGAQILIDQLKIQY